MEYSSCKLLMDCGKVHPVSALVCAQTRRIEYWTPLVTGADCSAISAQWPRNWRCFRTVKDSVLIGKIALILAESIETFPVQTIMTLNSCGFVRVMIDLHCHCNFLFPFLKQFIWEFVLVTWLLNWSHPYFSRLRLY